MSRVVLKSEAALEKLRAAAGLVESVLAEMARRVAPGVNTAELDAVAETMIRDAGATPMFKGYGGGPGVEPFPGSLCTSLNDIVVHGVPSTDMVLEEGDVISIDCGVKLDGFCGDFAYTFAVGEVSEEDRALLNVTKQSLYAGIDQAVASRRVGDIGHAVQSYCEARGYGVVRELVGHGVGQDLHEPPQVPNFGKRGTGKKLKPGMTLCIEPMINRGTADVTIDDDGWTVRTADRLPAAHYEHMVAIRRGGPAQILSSYTQIEAALDAAGAWYPRVPGDPVLEPVS